PRAAATPEPPAGHPPADDLAERGQVGPHVQAFLRTTGRDAKAGHHLVEDQQGAVAVAQRAERGMKLRLGRDEPAVPDVWLDDHRGQLVTPPPEQLSDSEGVVE